MYMYSIYFQVFVLQPLMGGLSFCCCTVNITHIMPCVCRSYAGLRLRFVFPFVSPKIQTHLCLPFMALVKPVLFLLHLPPPPPPPPSPSPPLWHYIYFYCLVLFHIYICMNVVIADQSFMTTKCLVLCRSGWWPSLATCSSMTCWKVPVNICV